MVTWTRKTRLELARRQWLRTCLACGNEIADALVKGGSLRCGDCRADQRPLDRALVEDWKRFGASSELLAD
jgi:hypothetical protein